MSGKKLLPGIKGDTKTSPRKDKPGDAEKRERNSEGALKSNGRPACYGTYQKTSAKHPDRCTMCPYEITCQHHSGVRENKNAD